MMQPEPKINNEKKIIKIEKMTTWFIFIILAFAVIVLIFTAKSMFFAGAAVVDEESAQHGLFGAGGFTEYDLALAKELMDKDGDGICDVCGMDVNICIEGGQLQCNMGGQTEKLNIGVLDKTKQEHHYHADFKVYIDGQELNFNQEKYFVKSRFIHVENDVQEDSGEVLHMHATGVPLWIFFESVGMKFEKDCFTSDTEKEYCNNAEKSLKFYVNGKENNEFGDYVFNDDDKLLISYGPHGEDISTQLGAISNSALNH
jgi:hypothetical protein